MTSPCQRSLALMRERGYFCAITEHWNQYARIRQDLFGFVDLLCLGESGDVVAIQTTSGSNVAARVQKIAEHRNVGYVRRCGWTIVVHRWRKNASGRWVCREVDVS